MTLTTTRRWIALIATAVLLATLLTVVGDTVMADATSGSGHNPYQTPVAVDDNADPNIFETTIVSDEKSAVDLGLPQGGTANVETFNGTIPGPELRLHVGETVIVHYENHLQSPSGIHWHGIEDDNASDGTPLTQNLVKPGKKFLYKFIVTRPGVYWYHPHHHSSTNQVFKGLYGSVIVTDTDEQTLQTNGVLPSPANTHTLVLSDITVCKAPGDNDALTYPYDPGQSPPWAGGGDLPAQQAPHPTDLCDTPIDEDGAPILNSGNPVPLNAGDVPNIQRTSGPSNEGQTVLTNGMNVGGRAGSPDAPGNLKSGAQTMAVRPGDGVRFQVINAAPIRYMRLRLTDSAGAQIKLVRVGGEGGLLDKAVLDGGTPQGFDFLYSQGEIVLGPGERADVVAAIPASATGVATLWTPDFKRQGTGGNGGQKFVNIPTVPVAHLQMTGSPSANPYSINANTPLLTSLGKSVEALGSANAHFLDPSSFGPTKKGMGSEDIQLTATGSGTATGINGVQGTHDFGTTDYTLVDHMDSSRFAADIGDTLELTVSNGTQAHHPFHPHGFSMQPIDFEKPLGTVVYTFPQHEFVDTVDIPDGTTMRYRVRLDDRPLMDGVTPGGAMGRWVFHCHIFFHAVFGMISEITVTDGSGNEKPDVNADDVQVGPIDKGQVAAMTGTFHDFEGDNVTLSASKGTVTKGSGTWSWSYTTGQAPGESGLVYITATDAGGKKDQAAFELVVTNNAPVLAPVANGATNEASVLNVSTTFVDADATDVHTGTIDWGDGNGPKPASIAEGNPGTLSASHHYGDNGAFHATATVSDGEETDSQSFDVVVTNVNPDETVDKSGTVLVNGVPTFLVHANQAITFKAQITDPGSDDLTSTWDWGDGAPAPDEFQTSLVNPPGTDPANSPSIQPRNVTHQTSHAFSKPCPATIAFAVRDDDGGTDGESANVIVSGPSGTAAKSSAWWQQEFRGYGYRTYTDAQRDCFLLDASALSIVFNETRDASTQSKAHDVITVPLLLSDARMKLDRELLAAWLNFAAGVFDFNTLYDTNGDGNADTSFANAMAQAEAVRNNPASTHEQLWTQYQRIQALNDKDLQCLLIFCVG